MAKGGISYCSWWVLNGMEILFLRMYVLYFLLATPIFLHLILKYWLNAKQFIKKWLISHGNTRTCPVNLITLLNNTRQHDRYILLRATCLWFWHTIGTRNIDFYLLLKHYHLGMKACPALSSGSGLRFLKPKPGQAHHSSSEWNNRRVTNHQNNWVLLPMRHRNDGALGVSNCFVVSFRWSGSLNFVI